MKIGSKPGSEWKAGEPRFVEFNLPDQLDQQVKQFPMLTGRKSTGARHNHGNHDEQNRQERNSN